MVCGDVELHVSQSIPIAVIIQSDTADAMTSIDSITPLLDSGGKTCRLFHVKLKRTPHLYNVQGGGEVTRRRGAIGVLCST